LKENARIRKTILSSRLNVCSWKRRLATTRLETVWRSIRLLGIPEKELKRQAISEFYGMFPE
jgi:hypothetical protein